MCAPPTKGGALGKLIAELRRRNVIRVAGVYAVIGWLVAQVATLLETSLGLPSWFDGVIVAALLLGLPIALILAWAFELTPEGMRLTASLPEAAGRSAEIAETRLRDPLRRRARRGALHRRAHHATAL